MVSFALLKRIMKFAGIKSLGFGAAMIKNDVSSPFEGNTIAEARILPRFLPAELPTSRMPTFLVVVAEKIGN
jgi:hypothetical protein